MKRKNSRRDFLKVTTAAGLGYWVSGVARAEESKSANGQIHFASVGVGGKGQSDSDNAGKHGVMVAICDVDDRKLDAAAKRFPDAKKFHDFREMLDEMGPKIDAVTVSTPDHTHAPAAAMAMKMGKHCFTQKPLTHSIYEARRLGEIAREMKVATQMGNQGTADSNMRKAAALVRYGVLGQVHELHVWTNRPVWAQGVDRPATQPVPDYLQWDLFLGPARPRPFANGYHTFDWRGWWDFGTGRLGDMACHTFNMPYMALDLRNPTSVLAQTSGHKGDSMPSWSKIRFEFPGNDSRGPISMTWYDGKQLPCSSLLGGIKPSSSGSLIIGDQGKMYTPGDYGTRYELMGIDKEPEVDYPTSPGHFDEFVRAIRGGEPAMSNFPDYAGPLTETILLGNLAVWADGAEIEWDAKNLRVTNDPNVAGLDELIRHTYREGYSL